MKRRTLIPIGVLVLAAAATGIWKLGLDSGDESGFLETYGNVDIRQVDLAFRVGGRVRSMNAEEGDRVAAGAVLAALDDAPLQHGLLAARVAQLRARHDRSVAALGLLGAMGVLSVEDVARAGD